MYLQVQNLFFHLNLQNYLQYILVVLFQPLNKTILYLNEKHLFFHLQKLKFILLEANNQLLGKNQTSLNMHVNLKQK